MNTDILSSKKIQVTLRKNKDYNEIDFTSIDVYFLEVNLDTTIISFSITHDEYYNVVKEILRRENTDSVTLNNHPEVIKFLINKKLLSEDEVTYLKYSLSLEEL